MLTKHLRYAIILLLLVACGGGGEDVDRESIAKSLEYAFNSGDIDSIVSLWSEDGSIDLYMELGDSSDHVACMGVNRDCWQDKIDRGEIWRFSDFREIGSNILCFVREISKGDGAWEKIDKENLRFDGDKIIFYGSGC